LNTPEATSDLDPELARQIALPAYFDSSLIVVQVRIRTVGAMCPDFSIDRSTECRSAAC